MNYNSQVSTLLSWEFSAGSDGKESAFSAGDPGSILESGKFPGEGNGCPLQYYCLENYVDRGAWWAMVHGVTESDMTELGVIEFTYRIVGRIK